MSCSPLWKTWTNGQIDEIDFCISPAGAGKSNLDGRFSIMNSILSSAVDGGKSYDSAATVLDAVESSGGMSATHFLMFEPDRDDQFCVLPEKKSHWACTPRIVPVRCGLSAPWLRAPASCQPISAPLLLSSTQPHNGQKRLFCH